MPATTKSMTLRLASEKAAELEQIARADEMPVSDTVREAIDELIERRRDDAKFQTRLKKMMDEDREVLARLAR